jgi:hypothetical protein
MMSEAEVTAAMWKPWLRDVLIYVAFAVWIHACGPQMSERKRIWIAPHWHGPKGGDVAAHIYKLQSADDRKKK